MVDPFVLRVPKGRRLLLTQTPENAGARLYINGVPREFPCDVTVGDTIEFRGLDLLPVVIAESTGG